MVSSSQVNGNFAPARVNGIREETEHGEASQLRDWVADLTAVSDKTWAAVLLGNQAEFLQLYQTANQDALDTWTTMIAAGDSEVQNNVELSPVSEIEQLGATVESESQGILDGDFIHFAVFDPGRRVVEISEPSVAAVTELIEELQLGDLLGDISVRELVLWHEYYHVWMRSKERPDGALGHRDAPTALTRKKRGRTGNLKTALSRWLSGFVGQYGSRAVRQQQVEELTAVLFSKVAAGIPYSPQVFQWLLVYTKEPDKAVTMMKDIIEKSVRV